MMKNRIKNILYTALIAVISIIGITTVYAKTGEKITLDQKTYINLVGSRQEAKFHTTMGYGYCITPSKKGADQGTSFSYVGDESDGGYAYIIEKLDNSDRNYLVKTLAVWLYLENYMPDAYWEHSSNQIVVDAKALANEAKNHKDYNADPTISVVNPNKAMSLVKEGNTYYYVSGEMSANVTKASTYTVTLANAPEGTQIVNANNQAASTFNNGEKFKIKVPEKNAKSNATIKVTVSATGTKKTIERYRPSNTDKQDLIIVRSEEKTVSSSTELTITPEKRVCEVFNGSYYGENGTIVDKETYDKECNHVCEIYKGKYYGEDGKETTKEEYNKQCNHVCEVYKGKYYGEDGKETTKEKYQKECSHVCEVYKGKYYGEDGKETTKEEYNKQCNHVCEIYKGKYFDSFGKETTLEEYRKQCLHICEIYNGKYYGKNGNEVDETTYDNECNPATIVVPPTGTNKMPIGMYLLIGLLPIAGGTGLILKTKKQN